MVCRKNEVDGVLMMAAALLIELLLLLMLLVPPMLRTMCGGGRARGVLVLTNMICPGLVADGDVRNVLEALFDGGLGVPG
eukprot:scaffold82151_cov32-Attheya_sp.AAC.1